MARENYRERAVVVRSYDFAEADRIVVLLTRGHGLVRGVAKGVRRSKSRFGSRVQLFVELDVLLYPGRALANITAADTVSYFGAGIIEDYPRYTTACAALEAAERLAVAENGEDPFLYDALLTTLRRIQQHPDPTLVLDAFLLQAMDHAGWAPSLFNCAQCGTPGPHRAFHPEAGGAVCTECRPPGSATPPPEALRVMWWLAHNQWWAVDAAREASISAGDGFFDDVSHHVHQMTRAHVQWHMERKVQALDFVDGGGTIGG